MDDDLSETFVEFAHARALHFRRTAYLMTGDWQWAEDLTQELLTRLFVAWPRLTRHDRVDAYARRTLVNLILDAWRRPAETAWPSLPDTAIDPRGPEDRLVLQTALARLPARQRQTVVLRYWEDLSVAETAELLRCSQGTVKSQSARGLDTLRGQLSDVCGYEKETVE